MTTLASRASLRQGVQAEGAAILSSLAQTVSEQELLTDAVGRLARRNEALEDFAGLVAHELKTPLLAALVAEDPATFVEQALDLVDSLLTLARQEGADGALASVNACFDHVAREHDAAQIEITSEVETAMPLSHEALCIILRNLLANAAAAGARHIHVMAKRRGTSCRLLVEDDGVGIEVAAGYKSGSGIGLALCRRLADRFGATLELSARPFGGTRATLAFGEGRQ